jgi:tetratricopeptide (TPR) repeat protein
MSLTKVASAPVAVTPQLTPASPVAPVVNEPVAQPLAKTEETPKSADVANKPIDQQKLRRERESSATARDMADSSRKSDVRKGRGISKLSSGASIAKRAPSAESIKEKAREYFQAGKFAAAAAAYKEASRLDPSNAGSFAGLGASLVAANDTDGAIAAYQRAIQLSPKTSGYHAALGRTYFTKGDRARAIKAYKKALEVDPNNRVAQAALARLGR